MKHKLYEMIVAKAANMDLVVMEKDPSGWIVKMSEILHMNPSKDYFLCLPQHKEAVLHSLNGGYIGCYEDGKWLEVCTLNGRDGKWKITGWYMNETEEIIIRPKKEKRWIIWDIDKGEVHQVFNREASGFSDPRFNHSMHEIEVEV